MSAQRPWILVVPLSAVGILAGHWLAYRATGTPAGPSHEYLAHLPRVALVLLILALVAASFVDRGARLVLWPFPAVSLAGFVVLEHAERFEHMGSVPFLLTSRVFLVGLAVQVAVALLAWLVARLLVVISHVAEEARRRVADWPTGHTRVVVALAAASSARGTRSRAPPRGR